MAELIWLVPFLPLLGVLLNGLALAPWPAVRRRWAGHLAAAVSGLAFVVALVLAANLGALLAGQAWRDVPLYSWIDIPGGLSLPLALRLDPLSVTMMLVVTGVGTLIHIFSIGYMAGDERYARFFVYLNLFMFAMLLLVLANNFPLLFVGWEGVGLCSYLLIGFWFERVPAAQAGKKAFLVNRVGDFGFLLAMFALYSLTGSLVFNTPEHTGALDQTGAIAGARIWGVPAATLIGLLFLLGATGKSAQLPLYVWLPDAMEGPTPVSALIHAATMVTAGVYLVARSAALYALSPVAQTAVAAVGIVTAAWAAWIAIRQYDIKRVLAYSTVSQLGFMFAGVGVGAYAAGISHLVSHAFFKALMFLGAGAVMHALDGQLDMRKMGNLRRYLPVTFGTFAIGWLSICGVPPFSGFWSKDAILEQAAHHGFAWVTVLGAIVAGMTAFYMSRMFFTVFLGSERIQPGEESHGGDAQEHGAHAHAAHGPAEEHATAHRHFHVHPEQAVMNVPLLLLAVASAVGGLVVFYLPRYLFRVTTGMAGAHGAEAGHAVAPPPVWQWPTTEALLSWPTLASLGAAIAGIALAWAMRPVFERGWSPAAERLFEAPDRLYEGLLHLVFVRLGTAFAGFLALFDRHVIDGAVNGVAKLVDLLAELLREIQSGYVRSYALVMLGGAVFVIASFLLILQQWPVAVWLAVGAATLAAILVASVLGWLWARRMRAGAPVGGGAPTGAE